MRSRGFNKRIEIWQNTSVDDGFGGYTDTTALLTTSWAKIESLSAKTSSLMTEMGMLDASNSIVITTRKRDDLDWSVAKMFIRYRGNDYVIKSNPTNINFEDRLIKFIATKQNNV